MNINLNLTDGLMIAATLISPFLAVYAQRTIERWRAAQDQKRSIFKTLMATRAATVSVAHVQALNMIDLEFSDDTAAEEKVRKIWREYLDHLGSLTQNPNEQPQVLPGWVERNKEYLADLLVEMGNSLGYKFDRVYIKKGIYFPQGHIQDEVEQRNLRAHLISVLSGEKPITTRTALVPADQAAVNLGQEFQKLLLGVLGGGKAVTVKIENETKE